MKRFLFFVLGLAVASSAMAGANFKQLRTVDHKSMAGKMLTQDVTVKRQSSSNNMMKSAVTPYFRAPITAQPVAINIGDVTALIDLLLAH